MPPEPLARLVRGATGDQNLDLQKNALIRAECELIFEDKASGKNTQRPGFKRVMKQLKAGDTLVVWKLDRLSRSMFDLAKLLMELNKRGVKFRSITDSFDSGSTMGRFTFHIMSAMAQMERELAIERTLAGLEAVRLKGRIGGVSA